MVDIVRSSYPGELVRQTVQPLNLALDSHVTTHHQLLHHLSRPTREQTCARFKAEWVWLYYCPTPRSLAGVRKVSVVSWYADGIGRRDQLNRQCRLNNLASSAGMPFQRD